VKANQHYDSLTARCCGVYWQRNGLELVGKSDGDGGLVDVDIRNDALYTRMLEYDPGAVTWPHLKSSGLFDGYKEIDQRKNDR